MLDIWYHGGIVSVRWQSDSPCY